MVTRGIKNGLLQTIFQCSISPPKMDAERSNVTTKAPKCRVIEFELKIRGIGFDS